jgi:hypothetical protein
MDKKKLATIFEEVGKILKQTSDDDIAIDQALAALDKHGRVEVTDEITRIAANVAGYLRSGAM